MKIFNNSNKESVDEFDRLRRAFKPAGSGGTDSTGVDRPPMANVDVKPMESVSARPPVDAVPISPDEYASVVSADSSWQGTLKIDGSVRIDGHLVGEIEARDRVYVAAGAQVDATIHAAVVIISGKVNGQVHSQERLEITPTAHVEGELTTKALIVHEGAFVEGQIRMTPSTRPSDAVPVPRPNRLSKPGASDAAVPVLGPIPVPDRRDDGNGRRGQTETPPRSRSAETSSTTSPTSHSSSNSHT